MKNAKGIFSQKDLEEYDKKLAELNTLRADAESAVYDNDEKYHNGEIAFDEYWENTLVLCNAARKAETDMLDRWAVLTSEDPNSLSNINGYKFSQDS